jgi:DNA-binding CsgD family transcriptional regulator/tetratricopeptide (TPR) repeat protein
MLVGREAEQRTLDALLDSARDERGAALVLRGEPGIGKTALLEYAAGRAADMTVLRCVGIEAEHELPFAGMHQLVRPCLELVDRLPAPQAGALRGALGLSFDAISDRFLVSVGLLSLLAETCDERPVLCCVDDAQWLDRPSAEALVFAARRFQAERIALLLAAREGDTRRFDAPGLEELEIGALADEHAQALLGARLDRPAAPDVVDRLLQTAHGNPLALLELPSALSEAQLDGVEPIVGPPPVRGAVEAAFGARVADLPEAARRVLLVAAADEVGDLANVQRAAERLGLALSDLDDAEREGLVRIAGVVAFRHPLVRSAVYRAATHGERRAVHEALAATVSDPVSSVWHRAVVADGVDEALAAELEDAGMQAVARTAHATAALTFERSADLSEDAGARGRRLRGAAQATMDAGRLDSALALVERARPLVAEPIEGAQLDLILATEAGRRGSPADGSRRMCEAARAIADRAPELATELGLWAVFTGLQAGWDARRYAEAERILGNIEYDDTLGRFARKLTDGLSAMFDGDTVHAGDCLAAALVEGEDLRGLRRVAMPVFVWAITGDVQTARVAAERMIATLRAEGIVTAIVGALPLVAWCEMAMRRLRGAQASVAEGLELSRELAYENDETGFLGVQARILAVQGDEERCREVAADALRRSVANGIGWANRNARLALAELELALGDPRAALAHFDQLDPAPVPPLLKLATPDFVDAALRAGERERAVAAMQDLVDWAPVSRAPFVHGMVARCRAVLAEDSDEAEALFAQALALHDRDVPPYERARTQLAYGERLRRDRRKIEARAQLRAAHEAFEGLGAPPWAERARGELNATGESARRRDASTIDDLTPQELRIATLVAGGASNREVAAQIFVSPKTVEYHLRKVFMKLGVASRVELARISLAAADQGRD